MYVSAAGEEGSGADEARGEGGSATRVRVPEAGEASVDGPTAGQHAQERRQTAAEIDSLSAPRTDPGAGGCDKETFRAGA